ncbi:MAG: winged helix-turn-helix transcriptional regulator [Chloroflexi bacterium]|nr:winged helix-turn-helix transcriptional regulator [Chloroflexota bacterium]
MVEAAVSPIPVTRPASEIAARFFRGLGDPTRIRILSLLLDGEKTVSALVEAIGSPQGRVSSHLSCLRWCAFVTARREGRNVYYAVEDPRVRQILELGNGILMNNAEYVLSCQVLESEESAEEK